MKQKKTTDAIAILKKRFYNGKPDRLVSLEQERVNARIAREIYALRNSLGLTQKQLATMVGTVPSAISRLENADYPGHSLSMLQRIAQALNRRIEVRFVRVKTPRMPEQSPRARRL